MTKHEYHIALVLIALVTAGVLGHHWLNADPYRASQDCTLALYFSGPDGCSNKPGTKPITSRQFTESIENYFTPDKNRPLDRDVDTVMMQYTHKGLPANPPAGPRLVNEPNPGSSIEGIWQQTEQFAGDSLFFISDSHSKFLNRVLHRP